MGQLEKKVCIITGAAGSIGNTTAETFLKEGGFITLVDNNPVALEQVTERLRGFPGQFQTVTADVSKVADTQNYINKTISKWGKIDVIFSNAGTAGMIAPIEDYPIDVFDQVMAINVRASFLACKFGFPAMNDGGSVIITSSIMGVTADPGVSAYATSKHALIGFARVAAKEMAARKIRVNIIAPGPVDNSFQLDIEKKLTEIIGQDGTEMLNNLIPLNRHANPVEVAEMVLFLASDRSSFTTGSVFNVDGGMHI